MSVCFPQKLIAACAVVLLLPSLTDAQIVSRTAGGGLHVSAPFVNVDVPPLNTVAARSPVAGRRFFGRRRALPPQQQTSRAERRAAALKQQQQQAGQQPTPAGVPERAPAVAPTPVAGAPMTVAEVVAGANSLPTPETLAVMGTADLRVTLQQVSGQLQNRLSEIPTGAGWQRHLRVPGEVLFAPTQNPEMVQKTLARFDAVAGNPRYARIAGMPNFIATGATLRQLTAISGGPQMTNPAVARAKPVQRQDTAVEEILPTPAEPTQPDATRGERSILKRASR